MGSLYLNSLAADQRKELGARLLSAQGGKCFICDKQLDLQLHSGQIDIDHVEPTKTGGKDDESNFAVTHASCNRSKQASHLRVARVLARFAAIREEVAQENRGPNLSDVLTRFNGSTDDLPLRIESHTVAMSFPDVGRNEVLRLPLYHDGLSGARYFFATIPIEYLFHDDRINPRNIGGSLNGLVEEFFKRRPQLHVALAWAEVVHDQPRVRLRVFDGQHKATAQVLLGVRELPVRVFVNPDPETLLTANTNAGTTLRQVAFDKSVQRHLGSALLVDRMERYRKDRSLPPDCETFSEKDLVLHFKGEWREMRRYILDAVRDSITHRVENRLRDYVDLGGKNTERPLSYSSIEKTFYSFFIHSDVLETPFDYRIEEGENPRELEKDQITSLMNIIADAIFVGHFDPALGTARIENRLQKGDNIADDHLRAFRMAKEEILYSWLRFVRTVILNYFIMQGRTVHEQRLFQYRFPEPLWDRIRNFVVNLGKLPLWVNRDLSLSVFGGKQNYEFWNTIFETGQTPQGQHVLPGGGIDIMKLIQD